MTTIRLAFASRLDAPPDVVFAAVSTLAGVNRELAPWLRMGSPAGMGDVPLALAPLGRPLFGSILWAGGVLPFDRHVLRLVAVAPGVGFDEESHSLFQRRWSHRRRVLPFEEGTLVTDHLAVEPRLARAAPLVRWVVAALFAHRHRRLAARFGGQSVAPPDDPAPLPSDGRPNGSGGAIRQTE